MSAYHLAQINIARAKAEMDDPVMAGFVARLDDVNKLADDSPGFVWRLQTEEGDATALRPYEDNRILVNMSVWETPEALRAFVYRGAHTDVMRQRKAWFERMPEMYYALWWIPVGHIPTLQEAKDRLEHLRTHGESAQVFTFAKLFPAPDAQDAKPVEGFADPCPAL
ncbi:DUF3291 domain-containing protein [Usitatibacter palustris]|uniref:DUF3291 domain-containing protein n=1 Tax=Usitatibacter palustris TaxID=2732487 RepID=A0A6M4H7D0_9PROT|nr:DUF3291 domain-containing protein [Usitatibacter palustris]QJR14284.1 hypothetical protein DSM104440_01077 [Usitatibacter palustris]